MQWKMYVVAAEIIDRLDHNEAPDSRTLWSSVCRT
jgi:hypothetical protein